MQDDPLDFTPGLSLAQQKHKIILFYFITVQQNIIGQKLVGKPSSWRRWHLLTDQLRTLNQQVSQGLMMESLSTNQSKESQVTITLSW